MTAAAIFCLAYLGIALGKIPGLVIDRVGVAMLGAIAMVVFGVVTPEVAVRSIDLPTILLLYFLMIISAQLRLGGFYTWLHSKLSLFAPTDCGGTVREFRYQDHLLGACRRRDSGDPGFAAGFDQLDSAGLEPKFLRGSCRRPGL
jgi:hypothetical protein